MKYQELRLLISLAELSASQLAALDTELESSHKGGALLIGDQGENCDVHLPELRRLVAKVKAESAAAGVLKTSDVAAIVACKAMTPAQLQVVQAAIDSGSLMDPAIPDGLNSAALAQVIAKATGATSTATATATKAAA